MAVLIIFDSRGTQDSGPGYRHPKRELEVGDDFSLIVCSPSVSLLNFVKKTISYTKSISKIKKKYFIKLLYKFFFIGVFTKTFISLG